MEDNFFSQFLLDIQEHISNEVPEIRYIDQNLGQLAHTGDDDRPPLSYPAVLIDFPNTNYTELATNNQLGAPQIAFLLVFDNYDATWQNAPINVRMSGLDYLATEQKLHKALQSWQGDYCTGLSRQSARSQNNNDVGLRVRELMYTTEFEDWSLDDDDFKEISLSFQGGLKQG